MFLEKIKINAFGKIHQLSIEFHPNFNLIYGPNEAGKTSLSEAIWILFEYPDSSNSASVKAIRPVHRDVGPEIELTAEI